MSSLDLAQLMQLINEPLGEDGGVPTVMSGRRAYNYLDRVLEACHSNLLYLDRSMRDFSLTVIDVVVTPRSDLNELYAPTFGELGYDCSDGRYIGNKAMLLAELPYLVVIEGSIVTRRWWLVDRKGAFSLVERDVRLGGETVPSKKARVAGVDNNFFIDLLEAQPKLLATALKSLQMAFTEAVDSRRKRLEELTRDGRDIDFALGILGY